MLLNHPFEDRNTNLCSYAGFLDGGMVILAISTLNFLHPGYLFRPEAEPSSFDEKNAEVAAAPI